MTHSWWAVHTYLYSEFLWFISFPLKSKPLPQPHLLGRSNHRKTTLSLSSHSPGTTVPLPCLTVPLVTLHPPDLSGIPSRHGCPTPPLPSFPRLPTSPSPPLPLPFSLSPPCPPPTSLLPHPLYFSESLPYGLLAWHLNGTWADGQRPEQ